MVAIQTDLEQKAEEPDEEECHLVATPGLVLGVTEHCDVSFAGRMLWRLPSASSGICRLTLHPPNLTATRIATRTQNIGNGTVKRTLIRSLVESHIKELMHCREFK